MFGETNDSYFIDWSKGTVETVSNYIPRHELHLCIHHTFEAVMYGMFKAGKLGTFEVDTGK